MDKQDGVAASVVREVSKPKSRWQYWRALGRGDALVNLGIALLLIFAVVTVLVLFLNTSWLDLPITKEIQELNFAPTNWLWQAVSAPGYTPWNYIGSVLIVIIVALFKRYAEAAFLLLASLAAGASGAVKLLVHRGRPDASIVIVVGHPGGYSFPSGHVTEYTLFFGFCFYLIFTLMNRGILRTALLSICAIMIVLVGPSRIWLGAHWASDVLGGYALGFGLLLLLISAYRWWTKKIVSKPSTKDSAGTVEQP
ncbi:MAG TPA: phosphatase PAP2 family protein [Chloroflexia bacterium]|nr:phosphatase PAP2 family protein [Chloroflexia bacterium]